MSRIAWRAVYNDGAQLTEPEEDSKKTYLTIDRTRLVALQVIEIDEAPGWKERARIILSVTVHPFRRIFFRRRGEHALPVGPAGEKHFKTAFLIGWEEDLLVGDPRARTQAIEEEQAIRVDLVTRRTLAVVFPDGSLEIRDNFVPSSRWFYELENLVEIEKALDAELNEEIAF